MTPYLGFSPLQIYCLYSGFMVFPVVFLEKNHIIQTVVSTLKHLNQCKNIFKNTTFRGISKIQRFSGISNAHICSAGS